MVIATRKPLCNKRWSASPASQDLQLTQLRHPWVATKASCKVKKAGRAAVNGSSTFPDKTPRSCSCRDRGFTVVIVLLNDYTERRQ